MAQRFVAAKAWDGFIMEPYGAYANATTDEAIEEYLRNTALTFSHILGGAEVSPKGASWGVVDPDLKVKGAEGLRVVDASIFVSLYYPKMDLATGLVICLLFLQPYLPSAHPMAATYRKCFVGFCFLYIEH